MNISPREIPLDELYEMTHPDDRQSLRSLIDFICTGTISHHIVAILTGKVTNGGNFVTEA